MKSFRAVALLHSMLDTYEVFCKPICTKKNLPQLAFDILMCLATNPECKTAKDVSRCQSIKSSIVSFHVKKLVKNGYLIQQSTEHDKRRKVLILTEKANDVIEEGRRASLTFYDSVTNGLSDNDISAFSRYMGIISENVSNMKDSMKGHKGRRRKALQPT